jgi:hypothetical protein
MQTRNLTVASTAVAVCAASCSLVVSALFLSDVFGEYFLNTSYFFAMGWWFEFGFSILAVAAFVTVVAVLYRRRR